MTEAELTILKGKAIQQKDVRSLLELADYSYQEKDYKNAHTLTHSIYQYLINSMVKCEIFIDKYNGNDMDNEYDIIYNNKTLYPDLTYHLELKQAIGNDSIIKDIKILDFSKNEIPLNKERTTSVVNLGFYILYKCKNENDCSLREEYNNKSSTNIFFLLFVYNGSFCDHQNPKSQLKEEIAIRHFHLPLEIILNTIYLIGILLHTKKKKVFLECLEQKKKHMEENLLAQINFQFHQKV